MKDPQPRQEAAVGPFTLRETLVIGALTLLFVGSLLPFVGGEIEQGNLWNTAPLFFLGIGILLPVAVGALLVARRIGSGPLRIGSLSVDQFASVAAVLTTAFFFLETVTEFRVGPFVALIGALGLLAATTLGPHLPAFSADFRDRPERAAHIVARDLAPTRPRVSTAGKADASPADASPAAGDPTAGDPTAPGSANDPEPVDQSAPARDPEQAGDSEPARDPEPTQAHTASTTAAESARPEEAAQAAESAPREPISATRESSQPPVVEAFWFAVGTARAVVDEQTGRKVFTLKPGDWEVGIEDRGHEFLVQDKRTGAVGVLRDLSNIERAPQG